MDVVDSARGSIQLKERTQLPKFEERCYCSWPKLNDHYVLVLSIEAETRSLYISHAVASWAHVHNRIGSRYWLHFGYQLDDLRCCRYLKTLVNGALNIADRACYAMIQIPFLEAAYSLREIEMAAAFF